MMENSLRIKDLPTNERPYERLEKYGPEIMTNAELLAIIIRCGTKGQTSVAVAQRVLMQDKNEDGLAFIHDLSLEQLKDINGIGRVKAIQLKALMELSKRVPSKNVDKVSISKSSDISNLLMEEMRYLKKEVFKAVLLNTKNNIIKMFDISIGTLNASLIHPRETFREAIKVGSASVIFAHNHPSGDPSPSEDDLETTARLVQAGNILGIRVLDHVIIGNGRYVSFKERDLI